MVVVVVVRFSEMEKKDNCSGFLCICVYMYVWDGKVDLEKEKISIIYIPYTLFLSCVFIIILIR